MNLTQVKQLTKGERVSIRHMQTPDHWFVDRVFPNKQDNPRGTEGNYPLVELNHPHTDEKIEVCYILLENNDG